MSTQIEQTDCMTDPTTKLRTFDPAPGGVWTAIIADQEGLGGGTAAGGDLAMKPEHVAAFKCGYHAAFERMLRNGDLAKLLANFVDVYRDECRNPADSRERANAFVGKLSETISLVDWLQEMEVPIDADDLVRPLMSKRTPALNIAALGVLSRHRLHR